MTVPEPHSPTGVIRTSGVADPGLGQRLGELEFKASQPVQRVLEGAVFVGVAWFVVRMVGPNFSGSTSFGGRVVGALVAGVLLAVIVGVLLGIVMTIRFFSLRSKYTKLVPAGAPMSGEFGPTGFSVQAGGYRSVVDLAAITAVQLSDAALIAATKIPGSKKRAKAIVVPRNLVPPQIAASLTQSVSTGLADAYRAAVAACATPSPQLEAPQQPQQPQQEQRYPSQTGAQPYPSQVQGQYPAAPQPCQPYRGQPCPDQSSVPVGLPPTGETGGNKVLLTVAAVMAVIVVAGGLAWWFIGGSGRKGNGVESPQAEQAIATLYKSFGNDLDRGDLASAGQKFCAGSSGTQDYLDYVEQHLPVQSSGVSTKITLDVRKIQVDGDSALVMGYVVADGAHITSVPPNVDHVNGVWCMRGNF